MIEKQAKNTSSPTPEQVWWDRYGHLHDRIWNYDQRLTEQVRGPYLADMTQYLSVANGQLLEFGCGTGWVGLRVAQDRMALDGVDVSGEQIAQARDNATKAGIPNARFFQGSVEQIPRDTTYDGVILHSLLHHLSDQEIHALFVRLAQGLQPEGRIYAYEPVAAQSQPPLIAWGLDKSLLLGLRILRAGVFHLRMQESDIHHAIASGWQMLSPDESPIDLAHLETLLPSELKIVNVTYWHMCAVAYANLCMGLRPFWRRLFSQIVPVFIQIDKLILRGPYRFYLKAWPMVGIKIEKRA